MAGNIDQDIETIAHAESGEDVRYAIVRAIQDLNQNGGNAQTLNGYSSDEFTKNPQFEQFVDEEVGQIHLVLDAINKGITLRVIELGNKWIGPEANNDVQIQVPDTVRDRQLLTVDDFYADIVEVEGGTGENASWQKSDRYDSALGIYHYSHGALASRVKLHFYAKRASATAVQDYNVHARDLITANSTYTADPGEAWDKVTVNVPIKEEITCNVTENHREYVPTNPGTTSYNKVVVDVPDSLEEGGVTINQATFDQTFTPTSPNVGFSNFRVQANVRFNTQPKEVRISDAEFEDITVTPDSTHAGLSQVSIVNDMQLEEVTVNQNGDVTPGPGYAALKKVTVQVPTPPQPRLQEKTVTQNGDVTADADYDGLSEVHVQVPTPRLQPSKSVILSQSGTIVPDPDYDAMKEVVVTVSGGGGGDCNIMSKADWDLLPFAEKKRKGLTVIKNNEYDTTGEWFDYSNISLPFTVKAELYQDSEGNISLPAMDNAIFFTGAWNNTSGNYDNLKLTATSLTYDSKISGSVTPYYYAAPLDKMVTILKNTNPCSLNYRNGYSPNGYYSYGAIISIDDANATLSVLGDFNDDQTHAITTTEVYDAIICMTSKGLQNSSGSNGLIEVSGTYDSRFDGNEKLITDLTESCISIYSNVAAGAEITISTPLGRRAGSAVIGVKLNNS